MTFEFRHHVLVDLLDVLYPVVPASHASLVADDHDRQTRSVQSGDRLDCPVDELNAVDRTDISGVFDDRAVSIEKHPWSAR